MDNDSLTMDVITGASSLIKSFNRNVGSGSSAHDLVGELLIINLISSTENRLKFKNREEHGGGGGERLKEGDITN